AATWFKDPNYPFGEMEKFFLEHLGLINDDEAAKRAVSAWLRLSEELAQDGYFRFLIASDSLIVQKLNDGRKASGKAIVVHGGIGEISATLTFANGRLTDVVETNTVKGSERPICQATKLLDPDPIVRQMAEQAILSMG